MTARTRNRTDTIAYISSVVCFETVWSRTIPKLKQLYGDISIRVDLNMIRLTTSLTTVRYLIVFRRFGGIAWCCRGTSHREHIARSDTTRPTRTNGPAAARSSGTSAVQCMLPSVMTKNELWWGPAPHSPALE